MITSSTSARMASVIVAEVLDLVAGHAVGRARVDVDHHPALVHDPARLGGVLLGRVGDGRALVAVGHRPADGAGDHDRVLEAAHARLSGGTSRPCSEHSISWLQSLQPGLLLLGAGDPVDRRRAGTRGLALEVLAGRRRERPSRTPAAAPRSARTRSCRRPSSPPRGPRRRGGRPSVIRPASSSSAILRMLTLLQLLPFLRGVKRCRWRSSSIRLSLPSIQPKHSAWSTACDQVIVCLPVAFFQKPTCTSVSESWCSSSHSRKCSGPSKKIGSVTATKAALGAAPGMTSRARKPSQARKRLPKPAPQVEAADDAAWRRFAAS